MAPKMSVLFLLFSGLILLTAAALQQSRFRKKFSRTRSCLDLPEEILEQMFGRLSVGVMSAFHYALQLQTDRVNLSCPSSVRQTDKNRLPVNLLSISPWAYRMSYDPARYPRSIPEAYCLCKGCLIGPHGDNQEYRSTPVYSPSVVLRRSGSCAGGRYSYSEVYVSIAVGCTCVPRLQNEREELKSNKNQSLQGRAKSRASADSKA